MDTNTTVCDLEETAVLFCGDAGIVIIILSLDFDKGCTVRIGYSAPLIFDILITIITSILYTGKFSWSFNFANFAFYTHKSNNLYGHTLFLTDSQKFDSAKIFQYMVSLQVISSLS